MMKKSIILLLALAVALAAVPSAFALINSTNTTFNYPTNNLYNATVNGVSVKLNITASWTGNTNLTNVSFVFTSGANITRFTNNTVNGTKTSITTGDFTYGINLGDLAEGSYTVLAELHNDTDVSNTATAANSSSITFVIDRTSPTVSISSPYTGSTVLPSGGGIVTFDWTPSDTNFGNCSLHLNDQLVKSRTSGTVNANVSSGSVNRFTQAFGGDNSSVRLALSCIDLAGLRTSSNSLNNFTFGVITSGFTPAQKQAIAAAASGGGGIQANQQNQQPSGQSNGFTAVSQGVSTVKTSFQKWAWAWIIGGVIVLGFAVKKLKK